MASVSRLDSADGSSLQLLPDAHSWRSTSASHLGPRLADAATDCAGDDIDGGGSTGGVGNDDCCGCDDVRVGGTYNLWYAY